MFGFLVLLVNLEVNVMVISLVVVFGFDFIE